MITRLLQEVNFKIKVSADERFKIGPVFISSIFILILVGLAMAATDPDTAFVVPPPPGGEAFGSGPVTLFGKDMHTASYWSAQDAKPIETFYQLFFKRQGFESHSPFVENLQETTQALGLNAKQAANSAGQLNRKMSEAGVVFFRFKGKDKEYLHPGEAFVVDIVLTRKDKDGQNGTLVVISKYIQSENSPDIEKSLISVKDPMFSIPEPESEEDVPGEDLKIIPRPPQSTRWSASAQKNQVRLIYATSLSVTEAVEFYKNKMPGYDWQVERETATKDALDAYTQATGGKEAFRVPKFFGGLEDPKEIIRGGYVLNFKGSQGQAQITVMPNFIDTKRGSIVSISYYGQSS